ncbi:MAG TPA: NUDIX domain-containing protein [Candidatus Saccharimonadales bacterium]|nr:NUDIX domain-containing protein [Candidatus Saccharimonadales bacterium]
MRKVIPQSSVLIPDNAELVFDGVLYSTYHWPQTLFDGSSATFEMLKRRDTAVIIGIADNKLILINEDQPHSGKRTTFPAGSAETADEDIKATAAREMLEETGYAFNSWRLLEVKQPANDIEWFVHIWLAYDIADITAQKTDPGEKIKVSLLEFSEVKKRVLADNGVLGENKDLFSNLSSIDDLLSVPEFTGKVVDR